MTTGSGTGLAPIVLVEDSPSDRELACEALTAGRLANPLVTFVSGEDALASLVARSPGDVLPVLILLDLNLPGMSGRDLLVALRRTPSLAAVPVVALTSCDDDHDYLRGQGLPVDAYLTKPVTPARLFAAAAEVERLASGLVTRPLAR